MDVVERILDQGALLRARQAGHEGDIYRCPISTNWSTRGRLGVPCACGSTHLGPPAWRPVA